MRTISTMNADETTRAPGSPAASRPSVAKETGRSVDLTARSTTMPAISSASTTIHAQHPPRTVADGTAPAGAVV